MLGFLRVLRKVSRSREHSYGNLRTVIQQVDKVIENTM